MSKEMEKRAMMNKIQVCTRPLAGVLIALGFTGFLPFYQSTVLVGFAAAQEMKLEQKLIKYDGKKPGRHVLAFSYTAGAANFNLAGEKTITEEYRIGNFRCGDYQIELADDRIGDGFIKTAEMGPLKIVDKGNYVELWVTKKQDEVLDEVCARN